MDGKLDMSFFCDGSDVLWLWENYDYADGFRVGD